MDRSGSAQLEGGGFATEAVTRLKVGDRVIAIRFCCKKVADVLELRYSHLCICDMYTGKWTRAPTIGRTADA